jgi:DNA-binding GntR family transcriptional regulator
MFAPVSEPDAYAALHAAIVAGELSPGERLVEGELAERLGVSRGAVREAIMRLGHEGIVVRERNRGARVRRFTPAEAIEILEARAALESLAAGYAAIRRTEDEARELRGLVADMARLLDHGELLSISERNAVLHRRILEIRTVLAPGRPPSSLAEHDRIVSAIAAHDRGGAERAMRDHLTNVAFALASVAETVAL